MAAPSPSVKAARSQATAPTTPHSAMVELKSRVLSSLSKLSDRDTHQIAVEDLDRIIRTLPADGVPMLVNALTHDPSSPTPDASSKHLQSPVVARREPLRLLASLALAHPDATAAQLPKVLSHIARRLKDSASDSSVRDACRDTVGTLSSLYLGPLSSAGASTDDGAAGIPPVVGIFMKPLFEAMGEQSKLVQSGAASCVARAVECAGPGPGALPMFGRLCLRVCKLIAGQNVVAKGALLGVVSSLAQVGAISSQNMQLILQNVRECLDNGDWATRKAAADTLYSISIHCSHIVGDGAAQTVAALEGSRFDKVKPVRDSMMEALQSWKRITGENTESTDGKTNGSMDEGKNCKASSGGSVKMDSAANLSPCSTPTDRDNLSKGRGANLSEKAAVLLMKRAPTLTDKLNPEFFQKLETRNLDDLTVEVVVPRKCLNSQLQGDNEAHTRSIDSSACANHGQSTGADASPLGHLSGNFQNSEKGIGMSSKAPLAAESFHDKPTDQRELRMRETKTKTNDDAEPSSQDPSPRQGAPRSDASLEGTSTNNKNNLLAIQRQLSHLERQQASLMNMLQDFMGGSHDSMITLENRVRGLERIVEEMAHDLTISSGRRGGSSVTGFSPSPGKSSGRYSALPEHLKFGRGNDGRYGFSERFYTSEGMASNSQRDHWRSDPESWDHYSYASSRSGINNRRISATEERVSRTERGSDQLGLRRAWEKDNEPFRLGEGPSARSAWQAAKDEATLEAIRVAGEDTGNSRAASRVAIPELDGEAVNDDSINQGKGPLWGSWTHAMDSLHVGDVDSAYAEVLSTGDALLLVKLMEQTGPVVDQLSNEVANEVLHAVGQFLTEDSYYDMALSWLQQLTELVLDNGSDFLDIPMNGKKEILLSLHEAPAIDLPEDWEGATPDQMMTQLARSWRIDLQQLVN